MNFPPNLEITKMLLQTLCSTLELYPNLHVDVTYPRSACACTWTFRVGNIHMEIFTSYLDYDKT
jgi:hypothetical protein